MTTLVVHLEGGIARARACLESLAALDPDPAFEAIVVDDAGADLAPLLAALDGDVRLVRNERRRGLAASAAAAADLASTETLVLLHGAPLLRPDALGPLMAALDDPDRAGAAAAPIPTPASPGATEPSGLPHPVRTHALALRRADAGALADAAGASADPAGADTSLELAAIFAELARRGRVERRDDDRQLGVLAGRAARGSHARPGRDERAGLNLLRAAV